MLTRSSYPLVAATVVATLFAGMMADTLFNLQEAIATHRELARRGVDPTRAVRIELPGIVHRWEAGHRIRLPVLGPGAVS